MLVRRAFQTAPDAHTELWCATGSKAVFGTGFGWPQEPAEGLPEAQEAREQRAWVVVALPALLDAARAWVEAQPWKKTVGMVPEV